MTTYWFVYIWGAIEIEVRGPFESDEARDEAAKAYVKSERRGDDDSTAHWLDITDGVPTAGDYSGGFYDEEDDD